MNNTPIFIVGVPRSGTTLLAAMLASHSRISCGPETHFFRELSHVNTDQLLVRETWPGSAIDFLCSIKDKVYSSEEREVTLLQKYEVDQDQIAVYLRQKEPSIPNIISAVTEQYMRALEKARWAEKTPNHIRFLREIRQQFPETPIVRIIRDPRDVALSLTKVPWGALSFFEGLLLWKRWDDMSIDFFQTDRQCYTLRYEDLISSPEEELIKLCRFIGEEFEPGMLDTSKTGRQMNSRNVPWMVRASQPIDASHRSVWKNQLSKADNYVAEAILGERMDVFDYPKEAKFVRLGEISPSFSLVAKYPDEIQALASSGVRFWRNCTEAEIPVIKIYMGDPISDSWLIGNKVRHLSTLFSILSEVMRARYSGQTVCWITEDKLDTWNGISAFFIKKILSPHKFSIGKA